jgi:membrane fusion protein
MSAAVQQPFFRPESLRSGNTSWLGRPTLALGLPITVSAAASVALVAALGALITFGTYTRRVDTSGVMVPRSGVVTISVPTTGWVRQLAVHEGDTVQAGTLLYTLDVDTTIKRGGVQQIIANALIAQRNVLADAIQRKQMMEAETAKQLMQTIANLKDQRSQLDEQIKIQQSFEARLRDEYTLYLQLFNKHNLAASEMDSRQQAWMTARSTLEQLKSTSLRLQGDLIGAEYRAATNPITIRNETDDLKNKVAAIDQDIANSEARRSIEIMAPGSGVVTAIAAQPGQAVSTGTRLLTIVPQNDTMIGQMVAPGTAVGFIRPGQRVLLRYSGFPYQKFGQYAGTVESVSRAALRPDEVQQWEVGKGSEASAGPYYRVIVIPERQTVDAFGTEQQIPSHMQVRAYVLLETRPLYQWILEPLYSVTRAWRSR